MADKVLIIGTVSGRIQSAVADLLKYNWLRSGKAPAFQVHDEHVLEVPLSFDFAQIEKRVMATIAPLELDLMLFEQWQGDERYKQHRERKRLRTLFEATCRQLQIA